MKTRNRFQKGRQFTGRVWKMTERQKEIYNTALKLKRILGVDPTIPELSRFIETGVQNIRSVIRTLEIHGIDFPYRLSSSRWKNSKTNGITPGQRVVLELIMDYNKKNGIPPRFSQIAKTAGKSRERIRQIVYHLKAKGVDVPMFASRDTKGIRWLRIVVGQEFYEKLEKEAGKLDVDICDLARTKLVEAMK